MAILDSGERRQFETGAVRDVQAGKGRCDLLPLDIVAEMLESETIGHLARFVEDGDAAHLVRAAESFIAEAFPDRETAMLEFACHLEEGAAKYGERNWQMGISSHSYIDSAVRHYLKHSRGDIDERHDRAFLFNCLCGAWTVRHLPWADDVPHENGRCSDGGEGRI